MLTRKIQKAFSQGQKTLIISCNDIVSAFFIKEKVATKLAKSGSIISKTDFNLIYDSGLKLIFCAKQNAEQIAQAYDGSVIRYVEISPVYLSVTLNLLFVVVLTLSFAVLNTEFDCNIYQGQPFCLRQVNPHQ